MFVQELAAAMEARHPLGRAETSWDNVGVLIEFPSNDRKVLLCIDLTDAVLDECAMLGVTCVLAYHPVIFSPVRCINRSTPILHRCITDRISIYSPHTALDGAANGINSWLLSQIPETEVVETVGMLQIARNTRSIGEILEVLSQKLSLGTVRYALAPKHSLSHVPSLLIAGAGASGRPIKKLFSESQSSSAETQMRAELVIVGEATHHDILYMNRCGASLLILEHTRSERGFLHVLQEYLREALNSTEVYVSTADRDPIRFWSSQQEENEKKH